MKLGCILALVLLFAGPAVGAPSSAVEAPPTSRTVVQEPARLYIVIDGLRGHGAADTAATIAVESIENATKPKPSTMALKGMVAAASDAIFTRASTNPSLKGMGATAAALWIVGAKAYVAHVGDCRVYVLRGGKLIQLTKDHSMLEEYLKTHKLTPKEIEEFPVRNVVVRALGMKATVDVDVTSQPARKKDMWLVASAGLTRRLDNARLTTLLAAAKGDAAAASTALTDAASAATSTTSAQPAFIVVAIP